MEDQLQVVLAKEKNFSTDLCIKISSDCEPQRKKRCIRFSSDLSSEDALSVGDSGFGEFSSTSKSEQNGGAQPTSFLHVVHNGEFSLVLSLWGLRTGVGVFSKFRTHATPLAS